MNLDGMILEMHRQVKQARTRLTSAKRQLAWREQRGLRQDHRLVNQVREFQEDLELKVKTLDLLFERQASPDTDITANWYTMDDVLRGGKCHAPRLTISELFNGGFNTDGEWRQVVA